MDDLISRQDAIDRVANFLYIRDGGNATWWKPVAEAILNIPSAQPEPQWMPCSERLPEEDGLYIVTTSKGQVQFHVFSHNGNSEEYWMRCDKAWMPLPEPYWEGEQDEEGRSH